MPDERTYRRRRAGFLALVLAAFILLTGSFLGAFGGTERGFAGVLSPIQEGASKVAKPVRDLVNWVGDTYRAKGQLADLEAERDALSIENGRMRNQLEVSGEVNQLRELRQKYGLDMHAPVDASLIAMSQNAFTRTIVISKGSRDGVTKRDPVIAAGGLIGTVIRSQGGSAVVRLITDPQAGVNARVWPADLSGPLEPTGVGNDDLSLLVAKSDRIKVGNLVTTAGTVSKQLPSLFPAGIPVGRVSKVVDPGVDAQQVIVRPVVDFRRIEVVTVLTDVQPEDPQ